MDNTEQDKVKSYIVSVNGEGLTADILVKHTQDICKLDAVLDLIRAQCKINDMKVSQQP